MNSVPLPLQAVWTFFPNCLSNIAQNSLELVRLHSLRVEDEFTLLENGQQLLRENNEPQMMILFCMDPKDQNVLGRKNW